MHGWATIKTPIDLAIATGQSNGEGVSTGPGPIVPAGEALQFYAGTLSDANDPVGNASLGSAWPMFGLTYNATSGDKVCVVPAAVGGSSQTAAADAGNGNWGATGTLFAAAVSDANAAISALDARGYFVRKLFVINCQGEQDAYAIGPAYTKADYKAGLVDMIARWRSTPIGGVTYPQLPFHIVKTGGPSTGDTPGHRQVREAQQEVADADPYTHIAFANAVDFISRGLMQGVNHYTQAGYDEMGRHAAINILTGGSANQWPRKSTWMPSLGGDGSAGVATGIQSGSWWRVDDLVQAELLISLTALTGASGNAVIGGLPFSVAVNGTGMIAFIANAALSPGYTQFGLTASPGGSRIDLTQFGSGTPITQLPIANIAPTPGAPFSLRAIVIYRTND